MAKHEYFLESDIIEVAGKEAIQKLSEKGNIVHIDFEEVERRADLNGSDRFSEQFKEVLKYINETGKIDVDSKTYEMPSGGKVSWGNPSDKSVHITRNEGTKSKLNRTNKEFDVPKFLNFGTDILKEGFKDLNFVGKNINVGENVEFTGDPKEITLERLCNETDLEPVQNQIIRINNSGLIYQVKFPLTSVNKYNTKFKKDDKNGQLVRLNFDNNPVLFPEFHLRGLEQKIAYDILLDKDIEQIVLSGGSGSGKTILAYVAAVQQILGNEKQRKAGEIYEGIILFKSNDIIGGSSREQGFLPGSAYEKVKPFMKSYVDAHNLSRMNNHIPFRDMLADPFDEEDDFGKRTKDKLEGLYLPKRDKAIEIEHLQYARGRTFENKIIIVDETQNYTPFEIKQLIERVGVNCKIILLGDHEQVDNEKLNPDYNGLVYAANTNFDVHPRFSVLNLKNNYRSQSAEIMRSVRAPKD